VLFDVNVDYESSCFLQLEGSKSESRDTQTVQCCMSSHKAQLAHLPKDLPCEPLDFKNRNNRLLKKHTRDLNHNDTTVDEYLLIFQFFPRLRRKSS
jgi:hypothetical protein